MSPRIQVYKAIACRAVTHGDDLMNALVQCDEAAVQARAAKIQAGMSNDWAENACC